MSGRVFLCGTPDRCEKHNRALHGYPCHACMEDFAEANPRTVEAIRNFAGGRGSVAAINRAKAIDKASAPNPKETP